MSIANQKKQIFGSIGAINAVNERLSNGSSSNSFSSVNNSSNPVVFLMDLVQSLAGTGPLRDFILNFMVFDMDNVESRIKESLKENLKRIVACSINPEIPDWFKSDSKGVNFKIENIDFYDIFKVNPLNVEGRLLYTDVGASITSKDFNTFLFYTIQSPGNQSSWGNSTTVRDILDFKFIERSDEGNNLINVKANSLYDKQTLNTLNNNYIDSMSLFGNLNSLNSKTLLALLMEEMFGSISSGTKSRKQIKKETEVGELLECIINSETPFDDSFFEFDNPTLSRIGETVDNKKKGIMKLKTCDDVEVSITAEDVLEAIVGIKNGSTKKDESDMVGKAIDSLNDNQANNVNSKNRLAVKGNFFVNLINKIIKVLVTSIISPKMVTIFAINNKILYGEDSNYSGPLDFIKKNKVLIQSFVKELMDMVVKAILLVAIEYLQIMIQKKIEGDLREKGEQYAEIVKSYLLGQLKSVTKNAKIF